MDPDPAKVTDSCGEVKNNIYNTIAAGRTPVQVPCDWKRSKLALLFTANFSLRSSTEDCDIVSVALNFEAAFFKNESACVV
jgi:hypothetical protein